MHVRHDDEGCDESSDEASQVSEIIDVREESEEERDQSCADQNDEIASRLLMQVPMYDEIDKVDGHETKKRGRRADFREIGQENRGYQVSTEPGDDVNETGA